MAPKPADCEILQRPVWDPAPGAEHVWACLKTSSLAMHRLSDRVLGALSIAVDEGLICSSQCDLNESDLSSRFKIRQVRIRSNLGRGLLTPDGLGVVAITVKRRRQEDEFLVLRGTDPAYAYLPVVLYNMEDFQDTYPNYMDWRNKLINKWNPDGTHIAMSYGEFPEDDSATVPADWPAGLTRDRNLASAKSYRARNLNPVTGEPTTAGTARRVAESAVMSGPSSAATPAVADPLAAADAPAAADPLAAAADAPAAVAPPEAVATLAVAATLAAATTLAAGPPIITNAPAPKSAPVLEDASVE